MLSTQHTPLPYLIDSQRMAKALRQCLQILASHRGAIISATELNIEQQRLKHPFRPTEPTPPKETAESRFNFYLKLQELAAEKFEASEKAWISEIEMRLLCGAENGRLERRLTTYGITRHDLF